MKVTILILAVAIVGAFAAEEAKDTGIPPFKCTSTNSFICTFQELGHKIKYHAKKLGGKLAEVGTSVLKSALDQGKSLLANGAQAVAGTVLEHLNKEGLVGKREMGFFSQLKERLGQGFAKLKAFKEGLHAAFKKALTKLTGVAKDTADLKELDKSSDKKIDDAVEEFKKEGKKGFFGMATAIATKLREIFKAGMEKLREKYGKKVEERALFDSLKNAWENAKASLAGVAGKIADTFKPHLDTIKDGVAKFGDKLKEFGKGVATAAKGQFDAIKSKLSGHIDTLKGHAAKLGGHAVNAVNALKEALSSIAKQAVSNATNTLGDIVKTGTDAAGVVAGHVADAVKGN